MAGAKNEKMITLKAYEKIMHAREQKIGKELAEIREKYEVLKRLRDKTTRTRGDVEKAMKKVLCFGSISFCCGSPLNPHGEGKQCMFRDSFLDSLSLTWDDYERIKTKMEESFWGYLGGAVID